MNIKKRMGSFLMTGMAAFPLFFAQTYSTSRSQQNSALVFALMLAFARLGFFPFAHIAIHS
ncbi:hypothetical protein [Paenibacillus konkukensis]|uniref:hypothetical protein n=1 Tax=Paenibacillus konkukensis TaxID=2020716 RepID=UPI00201E1438|nr:hypothetical protein [Paenibacillus konkukensis]